MFSAKLFESSLGVRRATWVALGCLAFWRLGYEGLQRGFWQGSQWNLGHVIDPRNYNDYGFPTAEFSYVLKALTWSAAEIASVVVGTVIALEAFHWIKRGFAHKEDASQ
jgi:hypothetical protein